MVRKVVNGEEHQVIHLSKREALKAVDLHLINNGKEPRSENEHERTTDGAGGQTHLSYSSLKYALGDMRLWEMYMRGQLKKESEALRFGSLYDLLLFEPEKAQDTTTFSMILAYYRFYWRR